MTATNDEPSFRDLSPDEARAVLARNGFGRLAYSFRDRVDMRPLSYVYHEGWLYGRTEDSAKLKTLRHNQWVAFEVDEVEGPFDWVSVVVKGGLYQLSPEEEAGRERWEQALARLRAVWPRLFMDDDPTPRRTVLFRIAVQEISGRAASTRDAPTSLGLADRAAPADAPPRGATPTQRRTPERGAPGREVERPGNV